MDQGTKLSMPVQWSIPVISTKDIVSMMANALVISDADKIIVQLNLAMTLTLTVAMIIVVNG